MLTVTEIAERTAERKAKGLIPKYSSHCTTKEPRTTCKNLGDLLPETMPCPSCGGKVVSLKMYRCDAYDRGCTIGKRVNDIPCCDGVCPEYERKE